MKHIKIYLCMALAVLMVLQVPTNVYASSSDTSLKDWSIGEKKTWLEMNFTNFLAEGFHVIIAGKPLTEYVNSMKNTWETQGLTYDEWLDKNLKVEPETKNINMSDEFMDTCNTFVNEYVNSHKNPWTEVQVYSYSDVETSMFKTKPIMDTYIKICKQYLDGNHFVKYWPKNQGNDGMDVYIYSYDSLDSDGCRYYEANLTYQWEIVKKKHCKHIFINPNGNSTEQVILENELNNIEGDQQRITYETNYPNIKPYVLFDRNKTVRVFKTLDDVKQYDVGKRPYYTGNGFGTYDASQDNSTTMKADQIAQGDIYNDYSQHIINNGGNGLTEDELRDILDDYLKNNKPGGNGGGGSDGGGGGISAIIKGISAFFDGILTILGKLLEYLGKAIELFSGTLTKIIDVIPKGIGQLLTLVFPFIPQEWVTVIELSLVLSLVGIIIKIFKG